MASFKWPDFKILDCTIRDGGYINNWQFDKKLAREIYRALSKAGVDYVEIGYRGTEKYFSKSQYGIWRFTPDELVKEVTSNIDGAKLAIMADYGKVDADDFDNSDNSPIELVRLAAHKNCLKDALMLLEKIKAKGYKVALNAMGYTSYSDGERRDLAKMVKASSIDCIYVVDSYGALLPDQIKPLLGDLLEISGVRVGFHPHNSLQMAFANTLEAIECGVHMIDTTIYGMGRAAGNLPTEIVVSMLEKERMGKYNSMPILNIIDRYFVAMQERGKWGYQLPYMLSGMFQCHPGYAKALVDAREYTIEDIWKAMDYVKAKDVPGFSKPLLDELINEGIVGSSPRNEDGLPFAQAHASYDFKKARPSYVDRHKDRDVLVLANGPSLKEYKDKIDEFIRRFDPIILGANFLGGLFDPHYHAFTNKRRFVSYIDTVGSASRLLIGESIHDEMIREYTDRSYEKIYYVDSLTSKFDIRDGVITTNCRTVAILLLGLAIVMGAKRIFAAGMDGYGQERARPSLHFYNEADEKEDREMIMERHRWCQNFIQQIDDYLAGHGKEGVHIITPTSYRSFYKGVESYV